MTTVEEIIDQGRREGRPQGWMVEQVQELYGLSVLAANERIAFAMHGDDIVDTKAQRPTGQQLFDEMTKAEQDEAFGPEAAEMLRSGEATLADFVKHDGDFIIRKPVEDL